jgi:predicted DNA-binding transcriptional regulator AlpA
MSEPLKRPEHVGAELGISREQVIRRCRTKEFPHVRIGQAYRFTDDDVAAIIAAHRVEPVSEVSEAENPWGRITRGERQAS